MSGLTKRDKFTIEDDPYSSAAGKVVVYYELPLGRDVVVPGDKIRIKNQRGLFVFRRLAHNIEKNVQWVDCYEVLGGKYRAFYVDKVKSVYRPKKSRVKRIG